MAGRILMIVDGPAAMVYAPELLIRLRGDGFTVKVAPTGYAGVSALTFVSEVGWAACSGHPCMAVEKLDDAALAWPEAIVLAPVSPRVLQVFQNGRALELLKKAGKPVIAAPARLTTESAESSAEWLAQLPKGSRVLEGIADSRLDLGALGQLRIAPAEALRLAIHAALSRGDFAGVPVLITAGPTIEDIDPVRFISNRSTGRMGLALAEAAAVRGAQVTVVHGPMTLPVPALPNLEAVAVRSAQEMHDAVLARWSSCRLAILCAAVADFTPDHYAPEKIKKLDGQCLDLHLRRTPDILAELGAHPHHPFLVGFAAESDDVEINAIAKLRRKHCDLLCANDIRAPGCGFATATNQITIFALDGAEIPLPMLSKRVAADRILDVVEKRMDRGL